MADEIFKYLAKSQDIPDNKFTPVAFDRAFVVAADKAGHYRLKAGIHIEKNAKLGGTLYTWLVRSKVEVLAFDFVSYCQPQDTVSKLCWEGDLAENDTVELVVLHAHGKPITLSGLAFGTFLTAIYTGGAAPTPAPTPTPVPLPVGMPNPLG